MQAVRLPVLLGTVTYARAVVDATWPLHTAHAHAASPRDLDARAQDEDASSSIGTIHNELGASRHVHVSNVGPRRRSSASSSTSSQKERMDRAGSWTSSLLSVGQESAASSVLPTPEPSPRAVLFGQPKASMSPVHLPTVEEQAVQAAVAPESEVLASLRQEASNPANTRSASVNSDFSISAYDYSPMLGHQKTRGDSPHLRTVPGTRFSSESSAPVRLVEQDGDVQRLQAGSSASSAPSRRSSAQTAGSTSESVRSAQGTSCSVKMGGLSGLGAAREMKEQIKGRRRAATNADHLTDDQTVARRQSSPPTSTPARFQAQHNLAHGTISARQRSLFLGDRPRTANDRAPCSPLSRLTFGTDRPRGTTASDKGIASALHSTDYIFAHAYGPAPPRSANSSKAGSRPGTSTGKALGGIVASSFGLISPAGDHRSVYSGGSQSSSVDDPSHASDEARLLGTGSVRSRSRSTSSYASSTARLVGGAQGPQPADEWTGPPQFFSLSIDQEAFREIYPVFRLHSVDPTAASVEYLPAAGPRRCYPFHHAAMEVPPILRSLNVVGAEDRDFFARQAVLPIKQEGIYEVRAEEGKARYWWKFRYTVGDRLSIIGKALPGEKVGCLLARLLSSAFEADACADAALRAVHHACLVHLLDTAAQSCQCPEGDSLPSACSLLCVHC